MLRGLDKTLHIGEGLWGQPRPTPMGAGPELSPILGVPFYLCVHPLSQNYTKFDVVTRGEGHVLGSATSGQVTGQCDSDRPGV